MHLRDLFPLAQRVGVAADALEAVHPGHPAQSSAGFALACLHAAPSVDEPERMLRRAVRHLERVEHAARTEMGIFLTQ